MKLTDLRGILQYIPQFREKTFILSVDGAIVTDENFANAPAGRGGVALVEHPRRARARRRGANQGAGRGAKRQGRPISTAPASPTRRRCNWRLPPRTGSRTKSSKGFPPTISGPPAPTPSSPTRWASSRAWTICSPARSSAWTSSCSRPCCTGHHSRHSAARV